MSIYTRSGDAGTTRLGDGTLVGKASLRVRAYGAVDEATCSVGFARCAVTDASLDEVLRFAQQRLLNCSSALATPDVSAEALVTQADVAALERAIDRIEGMVGGFRGFVLPSGCEAATRLHVARTVVRRAERDAVALADEPGAVVDAVVLAFLNRLSDLLFAAARAQSVASGEIEEPWDRHATAPEG